jgi:acyl transferase domain-containing protein/NADPH:quinone reductase-like Zn-dependent oxidoreductase
MHHSFGVGGANAHAILDDALHYLQSRNLTGNHNTSIRPQSNGHTNGHAKQLTNGNHYVEDKTSRISTLFVLSAADEDGISRQAAALEKYLEQHNDKTGDHLQNLAFTLSIKRSKLPWKAYAVGSTIEELQKSFVSLPVKPTRSVRSPRTYFVFTGQGAQWATMAVDLIDRYEVFREAICFANEYLRSLGSSWSLLEELRATGSKSEINDPALAQPICTAVQIALVDLLASWSILPQAVVGHSSGEIAAAYCAGFLSRASALRVAYFRGEATRSLLRNQNADKGAMLAVALPESELCLYITDIVGPDGGGLLSCGCVNSPQNTTVTGVEKYVDELASRLDAAKVFNRKLNVPLAYHSPQMLKIADEYRKALGNKDLEAKCTSSSGPIFVSSVTSRRLSHEDLRQPEYWIRNLVSQVKFSPALETIFSLSGAGKSNTSDESQPLAFLVEIGPHAALERPIKDTLAEKVIYCYETTLRRDFSGSSTLQSLAGKLFANGYPVDVEALNRRSKCQMQPKMLLDLPLYPFNSSKSYWLESRLSKNHRARRTPRHDFLGIPSDDWNPLKPKWRFTIRAADLPWVTDHKVDGTILYPGSGFLVMVFEAVRSLTTDVPGITGFRIRDAKVPNALIINPDEESGIESQLHMHSHGTNSSNQAVQSWDFWIYSIANGEWKVHFSGSVSTELSRLTDTVSDEAPLQKSDQSLTNGESNFVDQDRTPFYADLYQQGFQFGETFQTLQNIRINGKGAEAKAIVNFSEWRQQIRQQKLSEHLIHPATLDSLFHVMFAAQYTNTVLPRVVPTHLFDVYLSLDLLSDLSTDTMSLHGEITESGFAGITGNVEARSDGKTMVEMRGCKLSTLLTAGKTQGAILEPTSLFHRMDWKPDITLLTRSETEGYLQEHTQAIAEVGGDVKAEIACRYLMSLAVDELSETNDSDISSKSHMRKYLEWIRDFIESGEENTAALVQSAWPEFSDPAARFSLIEEYSQTTPWRAGIALFFRNLVSILREETDPLDILFNQGVAEAIYRSPLLTLTAGRLAAYIDLVAHKNSDLRILEVGGGTGSTTSAVLDTLCRQGPQAGGAPRFKHYDFTDVSPSFFATAQERYAHLGSRIRFKVFDLERDPEEQGFEAGSYDVIVAAAVIHATASIDKTLSFLKKLLKPGGELVFSEPTNLHSAATSGIFGVLPGWWLSIEDYRTTGPLLPQQEWSKVLQRNGFEDLHVAMADGVDDTHMTSLLVSRVSDHTKPSNDMSTVILADTSRQKEVAEVLRQKLAQIHFECDIISVDSFLGDVSNYQRCISLLELDENIMSRLTTTQFDVLQQMARSFKQIVWLSTKCGTRADNPEAAMSSGFCKTIMRENPGQSFICLNVTSLHETADILVKVMGQICSTPPALAETDMMEENGVVYIPRLVEACDINRLRDSTLHGFDVEATEVRGNEDPIELRFTPGQLDSFHFGPDASAKLPLASGEVFVEVKAAGINFRDVMVVLNQLPASYVGYEYAGIVTEAGASSAYSPGDRVCGLATNGSFRSVVRARESHMMRMPTSMPFAEAAAVPLAFATAQYSLCHVARLQCGESILIHSAAGAVGQAAIRIAQSVGAEIYVTVSTDEKKQLLIERYGLDSGHFFSSRHTAFAQQLMAKTAGRGVDVVLNSLSGLALTETWRCIAPLGRFIEIGKRDIAASKSLPMDPFERNVSYSSVDLTVVSKYNERLMARIMQEVQERLLNEKSIAPYPISVFTRSKIEDAFRFLQTGTHTGKAVVDWEAPDTLQVRRLTYYRCTV